MSTDPLTWLGEVLDAMTPARWEVEDPGTVNESNEWDAEFAPSYWTWEIAAGDDAVLGGQELDDPRANVAGLAVLRNLAPAMLAVVEAAQTVRLNAYGTTPRHTRAPGGGCRDDCIPCGMAGMAGALDAFAAAVREEQQRHG